MSPRWGEIIFLTLFNPVLAWAQNAEWAVPLHFRDLSGSTNEGETRLRAARGLVRIRSSGDTVHHDVILFFDSMTGHYFWNSALSSPEEFQGRSDRIGKTIFAHLSSTGIICFVPGSFDDLSILTRTSSPGASVTEIQEQILVTLSKQPRAPVEIRTVDLKLPAQFFKYHPMQPQPSPPPRVLSIRRQQDDGWRLDLESFHGFRATVMLDKMFVLQRSEVTHRPPNAPDFDRLRDELL